MPVQVVVLEAESTNLLDLWHVNGGRPLPSSRWVQVTQRLDEAGRQAASRLEILICYSEVPFENYDHSLIAIQATELRGLAPSAHLYAVQDLATAHIDPTFGHEAVARWHETAHHAGVDDVLEFHCCCESERSVFLRLVREACARSASRKRVIETLRGCQWQAVIADRVPGTPPNSVGLLDPFVRYGLSGGGRGSLVIVVRAGDVQDQRVQVERVLKEHKPSQVVVALLNGPPSDELKATCQERQFDWLVFRGLFELRYFLLRMNDGARPRDVVSNSELLRADADAYVKYQRACVQLGVAIRELGDSSQTYSEFLSYEDQLLRAIEQTRRGVGEDAPFNRAVEQLNRLSLELIGQSFNELLRPSGTKR